MNPVQFDSEVSKREYSLGVVRMMLWRRAMMKRTTIFMAGVLMLLLIVHTIEQSTGPTSILDALRVLAQILSGGTALFTAWLATTSTIPSWAAEPVGKRNKKG